MSLYRVKQFYWSLASKINDKDIDILNMYLDNYELQLFNKLPIYEQKHCINVAMDVKLTCDQRGLKSKELTKVALLHDIGKTYKTMNPVEKAIMVIMNKITKGKIKEFKKIKNINVYYNHGEMGYNILKKRGYKYRFLFLVRNHHNDNIKGDVELDLLKECDDRN